MSVTYTSLLSAIAGCFEPLGIALVLTTSAPVQSRSTKATSGSGSKVVATLRDVSLAHGGAGSEHGNSQMRGTLTFALKPSRVTNDVSVDSMSALAELGHRAVVRLDGVNELRASVASVRLTPTEVVFAVTLLGGHHVDSKDTDELLMGRV